MKITSLEVSGFRAFSGSERLDLDGDIVLVVGVNGQGKTSLFDAILWALTGEISRLGRPAPVVSLFSDSGEARVEVTIVSDDGRTLVVSRQSDGLSDNLLLKEGNHEFRGAEAEYELLRRIWPEGLTAKESKEALRSAMERGVYLQQDVLTDFLTTDTDQHRFNAISELIGTGRATELQVALESSRKAWSGATNRMMSGMAKTQERLSGLEDRVRGLSGAIPIQTTSQDQWTTWWAHAKHLGVSDIRVPRIPSSDAHNAIDIAMGELRSIESSCERRGDRLRALANELRELQPPVFNLDALQREAEESSRALEAARKNLAEAEDNAEATRRRQLALYSEQQELKLLAEVALRHLGEQCPVCQQTYDTASTRERLESMLQANAHMAVSQNSIPDLVELTNHVQVMEANASAAAATLHNARRQDHLRADIQQRILRGLADLGVAIPSKGDASREIESALHENAREIGRLSAARMQGEHLAFSLVRSGQLSRRGEFDREVSTLRLRLQTTQNEIRARQHAGDQASKIIDALRDVSSDLVEDVLSRLEPLLQRIYATADPHPEFRVARLISRMHRGRGRVLAEVSDQLHGNRVETPDAFLSSSQLNVLAVSVFLALNLGLPTPPLTLAILDDPIQSLDDLNLLGLVDLLRRMRERRQLMISTHDIRIASLLERKLRPVSASQRTILVELEGWTREGPVTAQRDITSDPVPFRVAVA